MRAHPSHDFSPISWSCINCGCRADGISAGLRCSPSTDDINTDTEAQEPVAVDYAAITRSLST